MKDTRDITIPHSSAVIEEHYVPDTDVMFKIWRRHESERDYDIVDVIATLTLNGDLYVWNATIDDRPWSDVIKAAGRATRYSYNEVILGVVGDYR